MPPGTRNFHINLIYNTLVINTVSDPLKNIGVWNSSFCNRFIICALRWLACPVVPVLDPGAMNLKSQFVTSNYFALTKERDNRYLYRR